MGHEGRPWVRPGTIQRSANQTEEGGLVGPNGPNSMLQKPCKRSTINVFPGSSMVEHSAVNRRVASSNLARGASPFFFNHLRFFKLWILAN
jgi:hypothetical protein